MSSLSSATDQSINLNQNITSQNNENNMLMKRLNQLQNHNLAARGELKEKTYLYKEIITQNFVLIGIIIVATSFFLFSANKNK